MAGSSGALWGQVQTWQGRANNAWGSSRVWNTGSSFEQDLANTNSSYATLQAQYNTLQTQYNTLLGQYNSLNSAYGTLQGQYNQAVSDRDTWHSRADQAWGPSRIWSSGASWESAYPPSLTVYSAGVPATDCSGGDHQIAAVTVGKSGQYHVAFWVALNPASPSGANNQWCNLKVNVGGVGQVIFISTALSGVSLISRGGAYWTGFISAGQTVQLTAGNNGVSTGEGGLSVAFIPTPANPN